LRQWVKKLVDQLELDWGGGSAGSAHRKIEISEELATLLFVIDTYNKNLFEIEHHSVRRTRDSLDEFAKGLVDPDREKVEKTLFRLRQFLSGYRLEEYTYIQKTFEDFKNIIWDFADQLGEEIHVEKAQDMELKAHLNGLREAVEANSIQQLRAKSREFIDTYVETQTRKEERRSQRVESIQKNLHSVKKQLMEANMSARLDHLTGAHNRKSFDEQLKKYHSLSQLSASSVSLIILDIDHFKKVNDNYGHDVGDFVIKECVRLTQEIFCREIDFLARIGGEEFAVILPDYQVEHCMKKAEELLQHVRKSVIIQGNMQIHFTVSMGIAELLPQESIEAWVKRADSALYDSKNSGRNRFTVATKDQKPTKVA
jgi:diguanylate cyclase